MSTPSNRRPDPPLSDSIWEMFSMKGKVVSITGGGGGIGFEVARAMAEAGADVAIW
jgi:sorbose reductase